jgi:hypothetical protein
MVTSNVSTHCRALQCGRRLHEDYMSLLIAVAQNAEKDQQEAEEEFHKKLQGEYEAAQARLGDIVSSC